MNTGTVKWFNSTKGYGFIMPDDGTKDVFVHVTAVQKAGKHALSEGDKVTYELQRGDKGRVSAVNLRFQE